MRCPACQGFKTVEVTVTDKRYWCYGPGDPNCVTYSTETDCPLCDGVGFIEENDPNWDKALEFKAMRKAGKGVEVDDLVHEWALRLIDLAERDYDPV